jgi:RND family efflux transporter MFP subunit
MKPSSPFLAAGLALLAALLASTLAGCGSDPAPAQPAPRVLDLPTMVLARQKAMESRCFPGSVEPRNSITLASKVSGTVVEAGADEGSEVQRGDVLLRIEDTELRQRGLGFSSTAAQASLEGQSLAAQAAQARLDRDRLASLLRQGAVSQEDYDKAQTAYTSLTRSMEALKAKGQSARHQQEEVQALQSYARVVAPARGILVRRFVDPGAFVVAGQPLASLDDLSGGYEFVVPVDESLLSGMNAGQKALLFIPALGPAPFPATVSAVIRRVDPATRTFRVKLALPAPAASPPGPAAKTGEASGNATAPGAPRAGMFGRAVFPVRSVEKLLVPEGRIARRGELPCLFTVDQAGTVHFRVVKTGAAYQGLTLDGTDYLVAGLPGASGEEVAGTQALVEVLSGVEPGERIVTGGTETLREGDRLARPDRP